MKKINTPYIPHLITRKNRSDNTQSNNGDGGGGIGWIWNWGNTRSRSSGMLFNKMEEIPTFGKYIGIS